MPEYNTPGVYISEIDAFPNSVVEVATAVPAFVGFTEKAARGSRDLTGTPTSIGSFEEFKSLFGGAPHWQFSWTIDENGTDVLTPAGQEFLLYLSMLFYFRNGGNQCYIVSIGGYQEGQYTAQAYEAAWTALAKEQEPTIYLAPDAVRFSRDDHATINNAMLQQCADLQSRMAILDLHDGAGMRDLSDPNAFALEEPINAFRASLTAGDLSYGAAYAPWLNTTLVGQTEVSFANLDKTSRKALMKAMQEEVEDLRVDGQLDPSKAAAADQNIKQVVNPDLSEKQIASADATLMISSSTYKRVMVALLRRINLLPPGPAMAGLWATADNTNGVWNAPANVSVAELVSPSVPITESQQQDMNVPLDGKAINAIRNFHGRGVLVWGARTLDGNSQDWRYINVRRTMIMLEQSIKVALQSYVFAANDAATWQTVKSMIGNFLTGQWKTGVLAGATPQESFRVSVGLGTTMTQQDILDGMMNVTVHVAVTHPAEFIVITFQQQMQTS